MFELRGTVNKIVKNDYEDELIIFKVKRGETIYTCRYNGYLPLDTNDTIALKGQLYDNEILIAEKPFVLIPTSTENIKNCIFKAIKGKGIGAAKVEKVYDELFRKHQSPNRESKIINYLTELSDPVPKEFKFDSLTAFQSSKLLRWWNRNFTKRRLYLLGLFDTEIRKAHMSDTRLYSTIKQNPFKVFSIPLNKAKEINQMLGKENTRKDVKCGEIARTITEFVSRGWTGCPEGIVCKKHPELTIYAEYLQDEYDLVFSKDLIYTYFSFKVEFEVMERLNEMIRFTVEQKIRESQMPSLGKGYQIFSEKNITLTEEQEGALEGAMSSYLSIITGGAGCGKTTLIKQLIKNFMNNDEYFLLTSFTGKAVLRIKESLGEDFENIECHTLHRIIHRKKSGQDVEKFYNVIIDECSMISTELMWEFLTLFRHKFRLILIGDCNQLPPIGTGSFFTELMNTERVPIYYLTQNKRMVRQNDKMMILKNANGLIDEKRNKKLPYQFETSDGFYIIEKGLEYCETILNAFKKKGVSHRDVTVITPYNKDIDKVVEYHQGIFLQEFQSKEFNNKRYYVGDRVMQTKNVYSDSIDLMNGEEGEVVDMNEEVMIVDYGNGKVVEYFWAIRPEDKKKKKKKDEESQQVDEFYISEVKHSFCKTVHKSQGSEYKFVILYIPRNMSGFLNVNLLYTAITRTKEKIWIVCDRDTLDFATIRYLPHRYEKLGDRLKEMKQEDETIMPNTRKKEIELEHDEVVLTNDDIWEDWDEDNLPQEMMDYYDY